MNRIIAFDPGTNFKILQLTERYSPDSPCCLTYFRTNICVNCCHYLVKLVLFVIHLYFDNLVSFQAIEFVDRVVSYHEWRVRLYARLAYKA